MGLARHRPRLSPARRTTMATRRICIAAALGLLAVGNGAAAAPVPPESHRAGPAGNEVRINASLAVDGRDPRHLALGNTVYADPYVAQVSNSHDGGLTWAAASSLPPLAGANNTAETTVALSGGRLSVAYLAFHSVGGYVAPPYAGGLAVTSSTDEGRHWARPLVLQSSVGTCTFPIEPAMASSGKTVVLSWLNIVLDAACKRPIDFTLMVATSHDGGSHWRRQQLDFHSASYNVSPAVAVDGRRVAVVGRRSCAGFVEHVKGCSPGFDFPSDLVAFVSSDAGDHFGAARRVGKDFGNDRGAVAFDHKTGAIVAVTAGFPNRDPVTGVTLGTDVVPYASVDNGRTWQQKAYPFPVFQSGARPTLASSADGTIALVALLEGPFRAGYNAPVLISTRDDGATWSCAQLLDSRPTPFQPGYSSRIALAVGPDGTAHPVWPSRREYPVGASETLFTTTVGLSPTPTSSLCVPLQAVGGAPSPPPAPAVLGLPGLRSPRGYSPSSSARPGHMRKQGSRWPAAALED